MAVRGFECRRRNVADRAVEPDAVVEDFDVCEHLLFSLDFVGELAAMDEFDFQRMPDAEIERS